MVIRKTTSEDYTGIHLIDEIRYFSNVSWIQKIINFDLPCSCLCRNYTYCLWWLTSMQYIIIYWIANLHIGAISKVTPKINIYLFCVFFFCLQVGRAVWAVWDKLWKIPLILNELTWPRHFWTILIKAPEWLLWGFSRWTLRLTLASLITDSFDACPSCNQHCWDKALTPTIESIMSHYISMFFSFYLGATETFCSQNNA